MRVVVVVPEVTGNGAMRFHLDLAPEMEKLGVEYELFSVGIGVDGFPVEDPGIRLSVGFPQGMRRRYGLPVMLGRLARAIRRADVVATGWEAGQPFDLGFLAAKAGRKPIVASVQNNPLAALAEHNPTRWPSGLTKWGYPRVDAAVCVSNGLVPAVEKMGVRSDLVRVIPNGIKLDRVKAMAAEPAPDWVPQSPLLLGVGRLTWQKGFDLLIRAHSRVVKRGLSHNLIIVGDGDREPLERLAAELGVSESVLLPGFLENPFPILARASLFCLPSRYEGWGLVLAEALALGVPVVAADCVSGPSEVTEGGLYGELVQPESVGELEAAIVRHLTDPTILEAKARLASEQAESFSVSNRAAAYASLFEEVLSRRRNQSSGRS
jgi:glycosyltransferase involved in cell wall biosynthesis